eukprot:10857687-Heterocapsa_arctica.AAC.1
MELSYGFRLMSAFFLTYHNVTSDYLTRASADQIRARASKLGFGLIDLRDGRVKHLERGWVRRALTWQGQDESDCRVALQLAAKRTPTEVP